MVCVCVRVCVCVWAGVYHCMCVSLFKDLPAKSGGGGMEIEGMAD